MRRSCDDKDLRTSCDEFDCLSHNFLQKEDFYLSLNGFIGFDNSLYKREENECHDCVSEVLAPNHSSNEFLRCKLNGFFVSHLWQTPKIDRCILNSAVGVIRKLVHQTDSISTESSDSRKNLRQHAKLNNDKIGFSSRLKILGYIDWN